jgi:hypothetical protein
LHRSTGRQNIVNQQHTAVLQAHRICHEKSALDIAVTLRATQAPLDRRRPSALQIVHIARQTRSARQRRGQQRRLIILPVPQAPPMQGHGDENIRFSQQRLAGTVHPGGKGRRHMRGICVLKPQDHRLTVIIVKERRPRLPKNRARAEARRTRRSSGHGMGKRLPADDTG